MLAIGEAGAEAVDEEGGHFASFGEFVAAVEDAELIFFHFF